VKHSNYTLVLLFPWLAAWKEEIETHS
jgi:hypothetical protein